MSGVGISGYGAWRGGGTPGATGFDDARVAALIKAIRAELMSAGTVAGAVSQAWSGSRLEAGRHDDPHPTAA